MSKYLEGTGIFSDLQYYTCWKHTVLGVLFFPSLNLSSKSRLLKLFLLFHMTSMQEYCRDQFWDPLCFWCISMTCLPIMQMILLHIPAYKPLTSLVALRWQQSWQRTYIVLLSGVKSGRYHSLLPRPNCCPLIAFHQTTTLIYLSAELTRFCSHCIETIFV